tara:strand:+ start:1017 stop:1529 length:513 start_codon:yes stop_codon:yes gene_type:complete
MGLDPISLTLISTALSAGMGLAQQRQAGQAAKAEAGYQTGLLTRKAESERDVLRENSRRQLIEKERQLAEVRVSNAARGFANSGTQLAVFGDIGSRLDDRINQSASQAMGQVASYNEQKRMIAFGETQRKAAVPLQTAGILVGAAVKQYAGMKSDYNTFGDKANPFGIFG